MRLTYSCVGYIDMMGHWMRWSLYQCVYRRNDRRLSAYLISMGMTCPFVGFGISPCRTLFSLFRRARSSQRNDFEGITTVMCRSVARTSVSDGDPTSKRPYPDAILSPITRIRIHQRITLALTLLAPAPPSDVLDPVNCFPTAVSELTALSAEVPWLAVRFLRFSRLLENFRQLLR